VLQELAAGHDMLHALGASPLAVLVPPWNRIAAPLLSKLAEVPMSAVSCYGPRSAAWAAPGVLQVNTHIDLIDWRGTRGFLGEPEAIALAVTHLSARRQGKADANEPTGLLSHHADHDEASWQFIDNFLQRTIAHPAVRWPEVGEIFQKRSVAKSIGRS